jgi:hypothetical protein
MVAVVCNVAICCGIAGPGHAATWTSSKRNGKMRLAGSVQCRPPATICLIQSKKLEPGKGPSASPGSTEEYRISELENKVKPSGLSLRSRRRQGTGPLTRLPTVALDCGFR